LERQLNNISCDINILRAYVSILSKSRDEDIIENLAWYNIETKDRATVDIIESIVDRVEKLGKKFKILKTQLPPVVDDGKPKDAYSILASLALGLEFSIDFKSISVLEYISYRDALDRKSEALKEIRKK
jgi:hypothetical protein